MAKPPGGRCPRRLPPPGVQYAQEELFLAVAEAAIAADNGGNQLQQPFLCPRIVNFGEQGIEQGRRQAITVGTCR